MSGLTTQLPAIGFTLPESSGLQSDNTNGKTTMEQWQEGAGNRTTSCTHRRFLVGSQNPVVQKSCSPTLTQKLAKKSKRIIDNSVSADKTAKKGSSEGQKRSLKKGERELLKKNVALRSQQPYMTLEETMRHRNSYFHRLCVDTLAGGFHETFTELVNLARQEQQQREQEGAAAAAQPSSPSRPPLATQPEKLDTMRSCLARAEEADMKSNFEEEYKAQHELARYFNQTGDAWLEDHMLAACLNTSHKVSKCKASNQRIAESNCNIGVSLENQSRWSTAAAYFESFYNLTACQYWEDDNGRLLRSIACEHLTRIYTKMAERVSPVDRDNAMAYLLKAYDKAKEGDSNEALGATSYQLGLAYCDRGDQERAIKYLTVFMEVCQKQNDQIGLGESYEAIAKAYESQGNMTDAKTYLQRYLEVAQSSGHRDALYRASLSLGEIYNLTGDFAAATDCFQRAYELCAASSPDTSSARLAQVLCGVTRAHSLLLPYNTRVVDLPSATPALLRWKEQRKWQEDVE
ncbi:PREDICTED: tetratricopeptide repeat protein 29-like [Priapulus caudatus]|uniref:Tetratricopeptide repeat protein 29 n=1 Tax=Priapulus caudatus TaxID=37621 RepID=A0ABM1DZM0_PRICU|nr:PREDICTED: tetratricopeptide repeat protein 29-like [Priapulus caudatus]